MHTHKGPRRPRDTALPSDWPPCARASLGSQRKTVPAQNQSAQSGKRAVLSFLFYSLFQFPAFKAISVKTLAEHELKEQRLQWAHTTRGQSFQKWFGQVSKQMDCYSLQQLKGKRKQKHRKTLGEENLTSRVTTLQPTQGPTFNNKNIQAHTKNRKTRLSQWKRIKWQKSPLQKTYQKKG